MMNTVSLTYFKQTGKYYSQGQYASDKEHAFEIYAEVRDLLRRGQLPDLIEGHSDFIVLVEPENEPPALIIAK